MLFATPEFQDKVIGQSHGFLSRDIINQKIGITLEISIEIQRAVAAAPPIDHQTLQPILPGDLEFNRQCYQMLRLAEAQALVGDAQ